MKLLCNKNNKKLMVHATGFFYSINIYKDFDSVAQLTEWLQDEGYISNKKTARKEYVYYYTSI